VSRTARLTDDEGPIRYIERTRRWYEALGYGEHYRWAHHVDVAFRPLARPLAQSRVTLLTTAAPYRPDKGDQSAGAPYNAAAKFYTVYSGDTSQDHDLRVSHVSVDRAHVGDDPDCWFPLPALRRAAAEGRVGALTARFHGVPTNRSQRHTVAVDVPELLARCRDDGADAAVLVPNCPVCHQTLSIVARHLEAAGIATVVMGAAKDIVEHCGVPRFLFSDFALGNAAGIPGDRASQQATLELALRLLESAPAPRTTVQNPLQWPGPSAWRRDYLNPDGLTANELAALRAANDAIRQTASQIRRSTLASP
jgi:D-proline reductase (dithiol) PrdB